MKRWLLIAAAGGPIASQARGEMLAFTSGDGDEPEDGDLHEALVRLSEASQLPPGADITREAHLIPIDDARTIQFGIEPRASVRSRGRQF